MSRILVECPKCKNRKPLTHSICGGRFRDQREERCTYNLKKNTLKMYWIDIDLPYSLDGSNRKPQSNGKNSTKHRHRHLERIGASLKAAEKRLHEIQIKISEDRVLVRDRNAQISLHEVFHWYLNQEEIKR